MIFQTVIILLALVCIAAYLIIGRMLASEKKYHTELKEAEKDHPLAPFFDPSLSLDEEIMSSLRPFGSALALAWADRQRLAGPDAPQGNGFHVFEDKSGYARVHCTLPGLDPAMLDWWYAWVGYEPIRHKIWFPGRHVQALYGEEPSGGLYSLRNLQGRTLYSIERIGRNAPMQKLEYQIQDPAVWGLPEDSTSYYICQEVKNGPFQLARIILRFASLEDGLEGTAHIWLGSDLLKVLRPYLAGPQSLYDWSYHTSQEMIRLTQILPQIFNDYGPDVKKEPEPDSKD